MTASLIPVSHGEPMIFTQSEATAAQRTWVFFLTNTADGSVATGKTIAGSDFRISKAGGAFGNAVGTVTEISLGWYKMVFDVGDLDTIGALACELSVESGVDPIHCVHQVNVFDLNSATVTAGALSTDAVSAAALASDAVTEIQAGMATHADVVAVSVPTQNKTFALGTLSADGASSGISGNRAVAITLTATGTFGSGTVQVQICADPTVAVPVWVNVSGATLTSNGSKTITLPVRAVRWNLSGSSSPSIVCTALVSYPTGH